MTDVNLTTLTIPSFSFPDIRVPGNRVERFGRRSFELTSSREDQKVVQPGVSEDQITEEMLKLLGTTELFVKKTTLADLRVWCPVYPLPNLR